MIVYLRQLSPTGFTGQDCKREMQPSTDEMKRITTREQMRTIECELFLLSARSGPLNFEDGQRYRVLCEDASS